METIFNAIILELFPIFKDVRHILEDSVMLRNIPKGERIFEEGDRCNGVPFIIKGTARVSKFGKNGREMNIYRITRGDTCALTVISLLSNNPCPATAIAEEEVEAIIIPFEVFKDLMRVSLSFQEYIYKRIILRFQEALTLIDEIIFHSTDERIIRFLLKNSEKNGDTIEITHDKIAVEIGTAREVVSRFLKELERKGWIQLARGKIIVEKRKILEQKMDSYL